MCDTLRKVKNHVIYCRETHPIAQNNTKSGGRRRLCYACWQAKAIRAVLYQITWQHEG